jgi:cellulose synthase/poly-beta-1,6-N-acetylglucosamine synthase-like glycosyltransferase
MTTPVESNNTLEINGKDTFCTYLLTIRRVRFSREEAVDFHRYFVRLAIAGCEVLVVDGSPSEVFAKHAKEWSNVCRHETVDPQYKYLNGKVNGIHTGIAIAAHECIILADDDIRYTPDDVRRMADLLENYDMVRPQNYFRPLPVWARTEAARMLINRAWITEGDYSGTLGVTRNAMLRVGHYDGDVLFDNEEIVRHFQLKGAHICYARDFFLLKLPPTFGKWIEQRPRQAYEDFVMHVKTSFFAAVPIVLAITLLKSGWQMTLICAALISFGAIVSAIFGLNNGAVKFFFAENCLLRAALGCRAMRQYLLGFLLVFNLWRLSVRR